MQAERVCQEGFAWLMLCGLACRYKLRSQVEVADVSEDFDVWTRFGDGTAGAALQGTA